jgi:hypothetical protein
MRDLSRQMWYFPRLATVLGMLMETSIPTRNPHHNPWRGVFVAARCSAAQPGGIPPSLSGPGAKLRIYHGRRFLSRRYLAGLLIF